MRFWVWIAAWLTINVIYLAVAIMRARPARRPPTDGCATVEGRATDPSAAE